MAVWYVIDSDKNVWFFDGEYEEVDALIQIAYKDYGFGEIEEFNANEVIFAKDELDKISRRPKKTEKIRSLLGD